MVKMGFVNEANSGFDIEILFTVNVRYYKPHTTVVMLLFP